MAEFKQIGIIHLSDLHYGEKHQFLPPATPAGDRPKENNSSSLSKTLINDLREFQFNYPVVLAISGDLTEKAEFNEFREANQLIKDIMESAVLGDDFSLDNIFVVPGNHDVSYAIEDEIERRHQWVDFANQLFGKITDYEDTLAFTRVHDRTSEYNTIVITLDSCVFVRKGTEDETRGRFETELIEKIRRELKKYSEDEISNSIKIAIVHHHPVLIPPLLEGFRGYDAITQADILLKILRKFGFHLILHGHKHNPIIFTNDGISGFSQSPENPIVICAGGSIGSNSLPSNNQNACNTYNILTVRWNPKGKQFRIKVITRGLFRYSKSSGDLLLRRNWRFETINEYDKSFFYEDPIPAPNTRSVVLESQERGPLTRRQNTIYKNSRGYFPMVSVKPSLVVDKEFEAILWVRRHKDCDMDQSVADLEKVIWYSGKDNPVHAISKEDDQDFCVSVNFTKPTLVLVKLIFSDVVEYDSVYLGTPNVISS